MEELGLYVVVALTVFLVAWYIVGRRMNLRRQKLMWDSISDIIKRYSKRVNYRGLGSAGFQISFLGKLPVSMIELTLINLDRENLIHYIVQKLMGKKDVVYLKASFSCNPEINLKTGKYERGLNLVDDVRIAGLKIFSDKPILAKNLILENRVQRHLAKLRELLSLSISHKQPHLIMSCNFDPETVSSMLAFCKDLGKIICSSGKRR